MENEITEDDHGWPDTIDKINITAERSESLSPVLIYDDLALPIFGSSYREPDIPLKYMEPIFLDASLPHIPVYTHLKTHDLKPIVRPSTPSILTELRTNYVDDTGSRKSSTATLLAD